MKYVNNLASLRFSRGALIEWENLMKTTVWQDVLLEFDCIAQFSLYSRTESLSIRLFLNLLQVLTSTPLLGQFSTQ